MMSMMMMILLLVYPRLHPQTEHRILCTAMVDEGVSFVEMPARYPMLMIHRLTMRERER